MKHHLALAFALALSAAPALAQEFKAGDITIEKPWARATPKGAEVGAGYLTIRNNGAAPDRFTGGTADFGNVEVHEMSMVTLAPNGYHLMFTGLKQPLTKGSVAKATLTFEHAGAIPVEFPVSGVGASGGGQPKKNDMGGMKM
jgi:copper(I)-binding protein